MVFFITNLFVLQRAKIVLGDTKTVMGFMKIKYETNSREALRFSP